MMIKLRESGSAGSVQNIVLAIFLTAVLLGTAAAAYYYTTTPGEEGSFTEFYIDPPDGLASDYPTLFIMQGDEVISVTYGGNEGQVVAYNSGLVTLGIVNKEHQEATYMVGVKIDGKPTDIFFSGTTIEQVGPIVLAHEEKWEQDIGFSPRQTGEGQRVEFFLYKDGVACFTEPLYLLIDVKQQD